MNLVQLFWESGVDVPNDREIFLRRNFSLIMFRGKTSSRTIQVCRESNLEVKLQEYIYVYILELLPI